MTPEEERQAQERRAQLLAIFTDRKRAYVMVFGHESPAHKAVMDDLKTFCRDRETCVVPGDRDKTFVLEGRREALLRIQDHLDLTPDQLLERYTRPAT